MTFLMLAVLALLGLGGDRGVGTRRVLAFLAILLMLVWTTWRRSLLH
jgi:hypothetical protein